MESTLGLIVLAGAATAAIWRWVFTPAWRGVCGVVRLADAHPVIMEIAEQFKPNAGSSLHDRIQQIERNQEDMQTEMESLHNKFDTFIQQVQRGGRRVSDP